MPKTDNRMRNYKSLEDTRRESGRKRDKRNMLNFRMVVFAVIFFIVATQETEFPTGYLLFAAFIIIIALVVRMVLQKRKASEENPNEETLVDKRRQDGEKNRESIKRSTGNRIIAGGVIAIVAGLVFFFNYHASALPDSFIENLSVILMILVMFAPVPIVAGLILFFLARKKHNQESVYSRVESLYSSPRYRRPVKSEKEPGESGKSERLGERYGEELNGGYIQSKSFADYPDVVDPWDIKDDKPPWEL